MNEVYNTNLIIGLAAGALIVIGLNDALPIIIDYSVDKFQEFRATVRNHLSANR